MVVGFFRGAKVLRSHPNTKARTFLVRGLGVGGDGVGEAFDDDAFGFEVGDAVVGAVSHEDGFG